MADFKASQFLVSNKDFYAFVLDGGYTSPQWWDEEGWKWVSWKKPEHPWFWVRRENNEFYLRTLVEEIPLPWAWPAEVNHLEARAYCNWLSHKTGRTLRLPTEAEWTRMRDVCVGKQVDQDSWESAPGNINLEHHRSSCPVNVFKQGDLYDVIGNVWQHTETYVYPFKGYRVHPLYDDFSMPTFDGRHAIMKGGAWVSTGNEATRDARYAFRRHFFQYIGIRFVEGPAVDESAHLRGSLLGMDPEVDAAAEFAYSKDKKDQAAFGARLAEFAVSAFKRHAKDVAPRRALDLYCGGGRVSFELTPHFESVIGSDFTARQLQTAFTMRERGIANYSIVNDFGEREARVVEASQYAWANTRERAYFFQADPSNMHAHMTNFDLIVAWNLLERTYTPRAVPPHLISRLNSGGILVIAAHYQYDEKIAHADARIERGMSPTNPDAKVESTAAAMADLLRDVAELVEPASALSAIFPQTARVGLHANMEVLVFRKL